MRERESKKLFDSITNVDEDYIEEAQTPRRKKKVTPWVRRGAIAACLILMAVGAVNTLLRFDYLGAAGGTWPGTVVYGVYYFSVPHDGIYAYSAETGAEKLLSAYWEDGWLVNEYGLYYKRGRSLYVQSFETGETRRLYSAGVIESTHIGFTLQQDGNIVLTVYNKHSRVRYELLLDGRTGDVLNTVMEPTSYDSSDIPYSDANFIVGERRIRLVPTDSEDRYDVEEDGKSLLPDGMTVSRYSVEYYGSDLWLVAADEEDAKTWIVLRPDGDDDILTVPSQYYCGEINGYLLYPQNNDSVWCLDEKTGDTWALEADADREIYEFTTDGDYLYSCVPWGDSQTCWKLGFDDAGKPVSMTLVSDDLLMEGN